MFIKIKLEPKDHNRNQLADENAPYCEIDSSSTIIEAKVKIESYVDVPAERLHIKTLTKVYQNHEKISDIWNVEQKEGASIMLFAQRSEESLRNIENCEPQFLCFLQLFESKEKLGQTNFKSNLNCARSLSNASSITLVADSSGSETESSSQSQSSSKCSSGESTDSDDSIVKENRKRRASPRYNVKEKVPKHMVSCAEIPPTICKYLEDFPCYLQNQTPSNEKRCPISSTDEAQENSKISDETTNLHKADSDEKSSSASDITSNVAPAPTKDSTGTTAEKCGREPIQVSTTTTVNREGEHQPSASITPERRDFIVILSSNTKTISKGDCAQLLNLYFEKFRHSRISSRLHFNENYAFVLYHGELWISCEDQETCQWILENSSELSLPYKAARMRDYFKLNSFAVVIPNVCRSNNLQEVFALLENQNTQLDTTRWIVQKREVICNESDEYYDRTVCYFCPNEVLHILIDEDSKMFLDKCNFKLNYCFWKVHFFDVK